MSMKLSTITYFYIEFDSSVIIYTQSFNRNNVGMLIVLVFCIVNCGSLVNDSWTGNWFTTAWLAQSQLNVGHIE